MTAVLAQNDSLKAIESGLAAFEEAKEKVTALADSSIDLSLDDWKDKGTLKIIADKRKELKAERVRLQKEGKSMRDLITPISKHIKSKEDELVSILDPHEDRLQRIEDWAASEAEQERQAQIEAESARIQKRIDQLAVFGYQIDYADIKAMGDDTFEKYLDAAKAQYEKEQAEKAEQEHLQRQAEEKDKLEREAEKLRIKQEREELDRLRKEQEEREAEMRRQQEEIEAERRKLEQEKQAAEQAKRDEEARIQREKEIKQAQEEAAERARIKAIEDAKEAERLKAEVAEKERLAAERKAARQPDKLKIRAYITAIKSVPVPEMKTQDGKDTLAKITELIGKFDEYATKKAEEL